MLVFISRQKFLRLRLQLNLIKVKPALGEYGQRGWRGEEGRWSAWYSYSKSDFIIIFNFWFTAHFERVPPSSNSLSLPLYLLLLMLLSLSLYLSFFLCSACTVDYVLVCVCAAQDASKANSGCRLYCLPLSSPRTSQRCLGMGSRQPAQQQHKSQPHTHTHTKWC